MSEIRVCYECKQHLPPETEHVSSDVEGEVYCMSCVKAVPYTETAFYVGDNWIGSTGAENCQIVEAYDDHYEEGNGND